MGQKSVYHLLYTLELHLIFSILKETPFFSRQDLKIISKGVKTESSHSFSIHLLIMSCPWALLRSSFFFILIIPRLVIRINESVLVVFILSVAGISIVLSIRVHCLAKELLNSSPLSLKFEMNLLLWITVGMQFFFWLFRNVFKNNRWVLVLETISF